MPTVYIIILNWNGWQDTIECLESVFRLEFHDFAVLVCDNASEDDSLGHIAAWARGELAAGWDNPDLARHTTPPVRKPIPFVQVNPTDQLSIALHHERLFLVQAGSNSGFAAGNNVGLRLALSDPNFEYAWLLNNDTVVHPKALTAMVERMEARADAGICGSKLLYYDNPVLIQALGGSVYNLWTSRGGHLGAGLKNQNTPSHEWVESRMKYVVGASMLVRRKFLLDVGLMNESYFLYYEEIDWATRARGKYSLAYAPESVVFHKEGASIGHSACKTKRSELSEYHSSRNGIRFTRLYFPLAIPSVLITLIGRSIFRYTSGFKMNARAVLRGVRDALINTM